MKVLLLGGTGAMGKHLVSILDKSGSDEIFVTSRKSHNNHGQVSYLMGNAHDITFLKLILSDKYDVIVDFMYYTVTEFKERVDILLENTSQYICISSARVYADTKSPIIEISPRLTEVINDPEYFEAKEYSQQKCMAEDVLTQSRHRNWTIIRPYITYSEERLQLGIYELKDWFYRVQNKRTIQIAACIANAKTTLTYGYDVASGIAAIIGKGSALGEIFHITGNDTITWREVLEIYLDEIAKLTGDKPKFIITKKDIFSSVQMSDIQVKYDRCYNREFDNTKINKYIDTSTFVKPENGIRACIRAWLSAPRTLYPDWWRQVLIDRMTNEKAFRKEFKTSSEYENYTRVLNDRLFVLKQSYYNVRKFVKKLLSQILKSK